MKKVIGVMPLWDDEKNSIWMLPVNSYHHQAVKELAPGLKPMAVSPDNLTEALYMPEENIYGLFSGIRSFLFVMMKIARESFRHLLILFRNNP